MPVSVAGRTTGVIHAQAAVGERCPSGITDDLELVARKAGERIGANLASVLGQARVPPFTVSIGLAFAGPGDGLSEVIASADAAMLEAKSRGRDRVLVAGDSMPAGEARGPRTTPPRHPSE